MNPPVNHRATELGVVVLGKAKMFQVGKGGVSNFVVSIEPGVSYVRVDFEDGRMEHFSGLPFWWWSEARKVEAPASAIILT